MRKKSLVLVLVWAAVQFRGGNLSASTLYGSAVSGELDPLYTIDQNTGIASALGGSSGVALNLASDWRSESFRIWGINLFGFLVEVDPLSRNGKLVGRIAVPGISGLAFDVTTDKLYATAGGTLFLVDPVTASATLVGSTGRADVRALAFDRTGGLFGVDSTAALIKIDPANGSAQAIGPTGVDGMRDLAIRPEDGAMFGVATLIFPPSSFPPFSSRLYQVNTYTGATSLVGPDFEPTGLFAIGGLAFSPAVPEPASVVLSVFTVLFLSSLRHRPGRPRMSGRNAPQVAVRDDYPKSMACCKISPSGAVAQLGER